MTAHNSVKNDIDLWFQEDVLVLNYWQHDDNMLDIIIKMTLIGYHYLYEKNTRVQIDYYMV